MHRKHQFRINLINHFPEMVQHNVPRSMNPINGNPVAHHFFNKVFSFPLASLLSFSVEDEINAPFKLGLIFSII